MGGQACDSECVRGSSSWDKAVMVNVGCAKDGRITRGDVGWRISIIRELELKKV